MLAIYSPTIHEVSNVFSLTRILEISITIMYTFTTTKLALDDVRRKSPCRIAIYVVGLYLRVTTV